MKKHLQHFTETLKKYGRILFVIKGSPDPDAFASSFALRAICDAYGAHASIISFKKISLPVNREFVKLLGIPFKFIKAVDDADDYDAYAVLDHQSSHVDGVTGKIPCAFHIDHHDDMHETDAIDFRLIEPNAGSTCTIIALLLKEMDLALGADELTAVCTALLFGLQTDTDKYAYAGELDYEALSFLTRHSDGEIIRRLSESPLSRVTVHLIGEAIRNLTVYRDWAIAGLGFVDASDRDSIPIVADFLLKRDDHYTIVVFAAVEDREKESLSIEASFRSTSDDIDLNGIIKEITDEGGARRHKGAYQVRMDYFARCPDKTLLWDVIRVTTMDILRERRDGIYITELKSFYNRLRDRVRDIFG